LLFIPQVKCPPPHLDIAKLVLHFARSMLHRIGIAGDKTKIIADAGEFFRNSLTQPPGGAGDDTVHNS